MARTLAMSTALTTAATALFSLMLPAAVAYDLVKTYEGESFFDAWSYYGNYDNLTSGDVIFVNQSVGVSERLTYVNDAGRAIVRVDNTTFVPYNEKRNTVMLISNDKYAIGTLWVLDAVHVPYGCSVWGAFWSRGYGEGIQWPDGGEIDIFEGINQSVINQMALHTTPGCEQAANVTQTGVSGFTTCDSELNNNAGCAVRDTNTASYGQEFADNGGGVWVTEFAESGIKIWFFSRANVPAALSTNTVTADDLGVPVADWPSSACDMPTHFSTQEIVLDLKLCGTWAGEPSILQETCGPLQNNLTCYTTYVIDNKSTYDKAYFEINSVKIYATDSGKVSTPNTGSNEGGTSTGSGSESSPTNGTSSAVFAASNPLSGWIAAVGGLFVGAVTLLF